MKFYGNNEHDDESCNLYTSEDNNEDDFDFNYNELVDI